MMNNDIDLENAALKAQRDELLSVVEEVMHSYNKYGHLLNFNVDIARKVLKRQKIHQK